MTKKTTERYMKTATDNLRFARELQRRDEVLMYCLIESGNLWHYFSQNQCMELKTDHATLIAEGYPATIDECKEQYPELFS